MSEVLSARTRDCVEDLCLAWECAVSSRWDAVGPLQLPPPPKKDQREGRAWTSDRSYNERKVLDHSQLRIGQANVDGVLYWRDQCSRDVDVVPPIANPIFLHLICVRRDCCTSRTAREARPYLEKSTRYRAVERERYWASIVVDHGTSDIQTSERWTLINVFVLIRSRWDRSWR